MSAPPPAPQADLIRRIESATVTRSVIARKDRYHLGAVYDADGALVPESRRFPDKHRARDPKSLAMVEGLKIERRIHRALYLGHAFTHFGHFLIETVPALWWARQVDDGMALIFHPFDEAGRSHPQHMSLVDQINAAAGADIVAGIDGSALHLSAFMRPGSRLRVLQTKHRRTIHFMNALTEVKTISVPARGDPGASPAAKRIEVIELDRALDEVGCPKAGLFGRVLNLLHR